MKTRNTEILSLKDAAEQLNVSVTSLHNWIKEGCLLLSDNHLTQKNIDDFKKDYLNKNKLSSRANKQYKDKHDHSALTKRIIRELNKDTSAKDVSDYYEQTLSESYKNKEGIFYTPQYIAEDMMKDVTDVRDKTFLDPCCGSGNFIVEAIKKGFSPENVYGYDIDPNAVSITKKRIKELCGYESDNIRCVDFLSEAHSLSMKFDYVFTNPPWGKKIDKKDKKKWSDIYQAGNSLDTLSLFYFACLNILRDNAYIGFLMPESFFNISSFEDARVSLLSMEIKRLIDYDKPFKGLLTKAMAFVAENNKPSSNEISCEIYNSRKHIRTQDSFSFIPKHIINFHIDEKSSDIIKHVFSFPHITLKDNAEWALGVITGNNKELCIKDNRDGFVPIYRGKDIFKDRLAEPSLFIDENLDGCRQVADIKYYKSKEKIIYRFISNKIICYHDTERRYILNSANLFILKEGFSVTHRQLCDLFNSGFMNWLFRSIFGTHKVLRSDLETLPIWHEYFKKHETFSEETLMEYLGI